jgi:nucleotide-binding universal stress UspA family protein
VTEEKRIESVRSNLERLGRECEHAYEKIELIDTIGFVRKEIIRHARSHNVDLIVVGKSERQDAMSRIIGSTAENLPHKAPCSVFIIPAICALSEPDHSLVNPS